MVVLDKTRLTGWLFSYLLFNKEKKKKKMKISPPLARAGGEFVSFY
jgi:hypothetical protein